MLNYIWGGLIILSLLFAIVSDSRDIANDTYRNGRPLPVHIAFPDGYDPNALRLPVRVILTQATFSDFYKTAAVVPHEFEGVLLQSADGRELRFGPGVAVPEPLATIRSMTSRRANDLRGTVDSFSVSGDSVGTATVVFAPVRFVKMVAIAEAAVDFAKTAVTIAFGLIGVLALWMGLLQIAEKSGLLHSLVRLTQPVIRRLFPEIPEGHNAIGMIVLNLTANMLGLGNAATPLGIKAMEELQELNPQKDTATNSMVMLLALNTASVQIVPPVLLVAIMGLQINQLFFSIVIVTFFSAIVAILATTLLGKMKRYKDTNPGQLDAEST